LVTIKDVDSGIRGIKTTALMQGIKSVCSIMALHKKTGIDHGSMKVLNEAALQKKH
jgi:hypothetical protein